MSYPARDSFQAYQQQYAQYSSRAQQAPAVTTSTLANNAHTSYTSAPQQQQQQTYAPSNRSVRSSHSPSSDDGQKPSLPSISNLFGMVDGERSSQGHGSFLPLPLMHCPTPTNKRVVAPKNAQPTQTQAQSEPQPQSQPQTYSTVQSQSLPQHQMQQQAHVRQQPHFQHPMHLQSQHVSNATRPEPATRMASHPPHDANITQQRAMIPPTPPMRTDSIGENTHSPSTISTGSSLSGQPYFLGSALNNVEADQQRATIIPQLHKRPSVAHMHPQAQTSPYNASPYTTSAYSASPSAMSASGSFYSPNQPGYPHSIYAHQRPLPSSFPPQAHAPPLHRTLVALDLPANPRTLHLSDLQQSLLETLEPENSQPLAHRREAFQVPAHGLRKSL
jgi:hypothetical protein